MKTKNTISAMMLIDKPSGWTSHDAIAVLRKRLGIKRIGHSGTLDPMATGLIIALIGRGTKKQSEFQEMSKVYAGVITFGTETDTWDGEGKIREQKPVPAELTEPEIKKLVFAMQGKINQPVPSYSAVKYKGTPLYKLARHGKEVPEKIKTVTIYKWSDIIWQKPDLHFTVECSSGTYVRSIAYEFGRSIGCGAHLKSLKRLKISGFDLKNAINAEKIKTTDKEILMSRLLPL